MLSVVETAYGISSTLGQSDIDTQAAVLAKVVKIADLQDATKVAKLVERYTAQYDVANSSDGTNVLLADTSDAGASILDAANGVGGTVAAGFGAEPVRFQLLVRRPASAPACC